MEKIIIGSGGFNLTKEQMEELIGIQLFDSQMELIRFMVKAKETFREISPSLAECEKIVNLYCDVNRQWALTRKIKK